MWGAILKGIGKGLGWLARNPQVLGAVIEAAQATKTQRKAAARTDDPPTG